MYVVRGKVNEPVAVQTGLGWVISGPLSYEQPAYRAQEVQVNFVGSDSIMTESLERNVQRLWDLEALGIAGSSEVYEDFVDSIAFNGTRYSVKLPWKEGHNSLPSNYELSLSRLGNSERNQKFWRNIMKLSRNSSHRGLQRVLRS